MEKHDKENIALAGIVWFTMLAGALLTKPNTLADDVVDVITIIVPFFCTIASIGDRSYYDKLITDNIVRILVQSPLKFSAMILTHLSYAIKHEKH